MPTYECLVYRQRNSKETPEFCMFHAPVSEILSWCDIRRLEIGPDGAQRALNESRVRSVKRYLEDDLTTVPTAVIVSLSLEGLNYPQGECNRTAVITNEAK